MTASNSEGHAKQSLLDADSPKDAVNNGTANETNSGIDLPAGIHAASRAIHSNLHHAVVGRIPLALPPHANSPHLYALGISRFAQIYSVLENAWRDYLEAVLPERNGPNEQTATTRYRALLAEAYVPAIARSQRLESDLKNLETEWGNATLSDTAGNNDLAIREAVSHMLDTIQTKPYALLAYSWIMYMALFNGGRWIRQQLLAAGPQFWIQGSSSSSDAEKPDSTVSSLGQSFLSFWYFDGDEDGEDIKLAYRAGFVAASKRLTKEECETVINEAKTLFQHCLNMVTEIDLVVALERKERRHAGAYSRTVMLCVLTFGAFFAVIWSLYRR